MLIPFSIQKENYTLSASSGVYTNNTIDSTWYQVTNLSCEITVSGNRPVFVGLVPSAAASGDGSGLEIYSTSNNAQAKIRLKRGSTVIYPSILKLYSSISFSQYGVRVPVTTVWTFDFPSKGTYTYSFETRLDISNTTTSVLNTKLLVKEFI